jgi:hypothetical protein
VNRRDRGARGQSTVEFALVLPLVLGLLLFTVQVGLVIRDQIMVVNAAREGARTAVVDGASASVREAVVDSGALDPARVSVSTAPNGPNITVTVTYRSTTSVPIIGALVGDITITESTTMRNERR